MTPTPEQTAEAVNWIFPILLWLLGLTLMVFVNGMRLVALVRSLSYEESRVALLNRYRIDSVAFKVGCALLGICERCGQHSIYEFTGVCKACGYVNTYVKSSVIGNQNWIVDPSERQRSSP